MIETHFNWVDYLVFATFLVISSLVGVLFGFLDRKKMTSKNFLLGGGDLPWWAVALSIQASFLSAIFILSVPLEIYNSGTMFFYLGVSYFIAIPLSAHFFLTIYYKLNVTSAYEYLEMRFSKLVRITCALTFCFQNLLYMSVVLYTPALALSQVTGLSVPLSVVVTGLVCTFYTFMGGMKATVWNDFIQMIVISLSLILIITFGVLKVEGFTKMWEINEKGGRILFNDFRVNPTIRTTFWTQSIGGIFIIMSQYASSQTTIQKFLGVKTLRNAIKSVYATIFTTLIFIILVTLMGLVIYAHYEGCDPRMNGQIEKPDQLVPLYVMELLGHLNGLPGLFIAAIFSASLSSLSGGLNALSAVTLTDFVLPAYNMCKKEEMEEKMKAILSRLFILLYGIVVTILGYTAQFFGKVVFQVAFSIFGFVGGPLTSVIALGMFFPFVNSWGAFCGLMTSLVLSSWVAVGAILSDVKSHVLPLSTDKCPAANLTSIITASVVHTNSLEDDTLVVYKISYMYYGLIAMVTCFTVGIIVSLLTGCNKEVDPRLVVDWYSFLPSKIASCLKCNVLYLSMEEHNEEILAYRHSLDKIDDRNEITLFVIEDSIEEGNFNTGFIKNLVYPNDAKLASYLRGSITGVSNEGDTLKVIKGKKKESVMEEVKDRNSEQTIFK